MRLWIYRMSLSCEMEKNGVKKDNYFQEEAKKLEQMENSSHVPLYHTRL
jgi:hypothetical protein